MAGKKTQISAKMQNGDELDSQHQSVDTPILPSVDYLTKLEEAQPGIIKWFMEETSKEAQTRRDLDRQKTSIFEAAQRKGQLYGFLFGLFTLTTTLGLAYFQAYTAAGIVGGTSLVSVTIALTKGKK